jgi:hypothetical protein
MEGSLSSYSGVEGTKKNNINNDVLTVYYNDN